MKKTSCCAGKREYGAYATGRSQQEKWAPQTFAVCWLSQVLEMEFKQQSMDGKASMGARNEESGINSSHTQQHQYDITQAAPHVVSRLYSARPREGARLYLETWPIHVKGTTSFLKAHRLRDEHCHSFRVACEIGYPLADGPYFRGLFSDAIRSSFVTFTKLCARSLASCQPNSLLEL